MENCITFMPYYLKTLNCLFKFSFLPMALAFSLSLSLSNPREAFCGGTWRKHTQGEKFFIFFLNLSVVRNFPEIQSLTNRPS